MKYHSPSMWTSLSCRLPEPLCSSCAFIAGLTTLRMDNGPMEARYVLRVVGAMGSCTAQSPDIRTRGGDETTCACHRHSGTWRIPESPPAAGFHRSARRAHAQALVRSGVAVARAPTHEATSGLAARGRNRRSVRPRAQAHGRGPGPAGTPRAGTKQQRLALSLNRGDTGGIYQNACLFYGALPAPVRCLVRFGWQL